MHRSPTTRTASLPTLLLLALITGLLLALPGTVAAQQSADQPPAPEFDSWSPSVGLDGARLSESLPTDPLYSRTVTVSGDANNNTFVLYADCCFDAGDGSTFLAKYHWYIDGTWDRDWMHIVKNFVFNGNGGDDKLEVWYTGKHTNGDPATYPSRFPIPAGTSTIRGISFSGGGNPNDDLALINVTTDPIGSF